MADAENLTAHELVAETADFYARLPAIARRSLRATATLADNRTVNAAVQAAGRGIVQVGVDLDRQPRT